MKKLSILCLLFLSSYIGKAQLFVDTIYTVPQMVNDFFDSSCVSISNITFQGSHTTMNFFDGSLSNIGLDMGIILTNGYVMNAVGPNANSGVTGVNNLPGDSDLGTLTTFPTYDASVLEFDLVPHVDTIFFTYVFGSDEYSEFATSPFDDVFGFFISGPGYAGPTNIATLPGSGTAISINNVNCINQSPYYVCNDPLDAYCDTSYHCGGLNTGATVEYDGFTIPLICQAPVMIDSVYHIKIGVADVSDQVFDSGVLLSATSLCGNGLRLAASFNYNLNLTPRQVQFQTTTNYVRTYAWDFGDGQFSNERNPIHDYLNDGFYSVQLITTNALGSDTTLQSLSIGVGGIENELGKKINMFPNPVLDELNIQSYAKGKLTYEIYSLIGVKILSGSLNDSNSTLNLGFLSSGNYLLKLTDGKNIFEKIIVKE